jgi:hypothetical protein
MPLSARVGFLALVGATNLLWTLTGSSQSVDRELSVTQADYRDGAAIYYLDSCPSQIEEETAALLAPLAAIGANFIVNTIDRVIANRTEQLSGQFLARGIIDGGLKDSDCIVVARGAFGEMRARDARGREIARGGPPSAAVLDRMGFAKYPAFYLELTVSNPARRWVLSPVFLAYAATSAERSRSGKKHVTLALGFSPATLGEDKDIKSDDSFAVFALDLGELEIGKYYSGESVFAGTQATQPIPQTVPVGGYAVTALVTEAEEPGIAIRALTEAFESKKGDLDKALASTLEDLLGAQEEGDADNASSK